MTIDEKAEAYAGMNEPHPQDLFTMAVINGLHDGFKAGAEWMLEKAVNFIRQHDSKMIVCHTEDNNDSFITQFKKAMEE